MQFSLRLESKQKKEDTMGLLDRLSHRRTSSPQTQCPALPQLPC